jgi:hypothetical protein
VDMIGLYMNWYKKQGPWLRSAASPCVRVVAQPLTVDGNQSVDTGHKFIGHTMLNVLKWLYIIPTQSLPVACLKYHKQRD